MLSFEHCPSLIQFTRQSQEENTFLPDPSSSKRVKFWRDIQPGFLVRPFGTLEDAPQMRSEASMSLSDGTTRDFRQCLCNVRGFSLVSAGDCVTIDELNYYYQRWQALRPFQTRTRRYVRVALVLLLILFHPRT